MHDPYFVLRGDSPGWEGQLLMAELLGNVPWDFAMQFARPLPVRLPALLKFSISRRAPLPDVLLCNQPIMWLISERLTSLLREERIPFTTYPVRFIDRDTQRPFESRYELLHLLDVRPTIDKVRSLITEDGRNVESLIVAENILHDQPLLVREVEYWTIVLIHEQLKTKLEESRITGYATTPVKEYQFISSHRPRWGSP